MLKGKLSAGEFAGLHDEVKKYYKQSGEHYLLQTEESAELVNARDREKLRAEGLVLQVKGLEKNVSDVNGELAQLRAKSGDVLSIERSWEGKLTAAENASKAKLDAKDKQLHDVLVVQTALSLATTMAGENAHLLAPVIEKRLQADTTGDKAVVRILDLEGKPTALKLEELQKEIVDSAKYKAILIASKASGSATPTNLTRPKAVPQDKPFKDLTQAERVEWHNSDPASFKAASDANQVASRRVV